MQAYVRVPSSPTLSHFEKATIAAKETIRIVQARFGNRDSQEELICYRSINDEFASFRGEDNGGFQVKCWLITVENRVKALESKLIGHYQE